MWIWRPKIYVEVFLLLFSGWPSTCEKEKKERKNDDDVENNRRKKKFREINPFFYLRRSMDASSIGIHNRLNFVNLEKSYTITATTSNFFNSPMCPSSFKTFTEFEWERDRFFFWDRRLRRSESTVWKFKNFFCCSNFTWNQFWQSSHFDHVNCDY